MIITPEAARKKGYTHFGSIFPQKIYGLRDVEAVITEYRLEHNEDPEFVVFRKQSDADVQYRCEQLFAALVDLLASNEDEIPFVELALEPCKARLLALYKEVIEAVPDPIPGADLDVSDIPWPNEAERGNPIMRSP